MTNTNTTAAAARNSVSPITTIITAVMRDATAEGNRQAELVVAMFKSEITYGKKELLAVLLKEGAERTTMLDNMIASVSDEFAGAIKHLNSIKDKPAKERTTADAFTVEGLNRKARAARIMFVRALQSVLWLRENGCKSIASNKIGTGALKAKMPDPEDAGEFVNETFSCNTLANKGADLVRAKAGKSASKDVKARNPAANVVADASKSLAAVLTSLGNSGHRKPITDFSDEVESNLETTLKELFAMKFCDDAGKVDTKAVISWANATFAKPAEAPKADAAKTKAA